MLKTTALLLLGFWLGTVALFFVGFAIFLKREAQRVHKP